MPDGIEISTRGRIQEVRKDYRGAAAEQIWVADLQAEGEPVLTRHSKDLEHFQNISELRPCALPWEAAS